MKVLEIVVCGQTAALEQVAYGFAASYQGKNRVTRLDGDLENVSWDLRMLKPDIVIYEKNRRNQVLAQIMRGDSPDVSFVGIDP